MKKKSKLFRNLIVDKQELKKIILSCFYQFGKLKACALLDHLKEIGFFYSTKAGVSLSIEDLRTPPKKPSIMRLANYKMKEIVLKTDCGEITEVERFQKIINLWNTTSESLKIRIINFFKKTDPLNPVYMMAFSGARGNISQVRQLIGMRGLMSNPSGEIIDLPITSNFREGLTIADYIISAYGARKGLVDTSLKTADSGYLTRRLIDVAHDIIIKENNCNANRGIKINLSVDFFQSQQTLIGRVFAKPLYNPITNNLLGSIHDEITSNLEKQIKILKIPYIYIRSPLTCSSNRSICRKCYGWDLSSENLIHLGEAVGILAAQSIGEPGTQLTMRTFHTGGVFTGEQVSRQICSKVAGQVFFSKNLPLELKLNQYGELSPRTKLIGKIFVVDYFNQVHLLKISANTVLLIEDQNYLQEDQALMELPSNKIGEKKTIKYISSTHSGEIFFKNNYPHYLDLKSSNRRIWILSGQKYRIPIHAELKLKHLFKLSKSLSLASTKITNLTSGIIFTSKFRTNNHLRSFQILQHSKILNNFKFYLEKKENISKSLSSYLLKNTLVRLDFNTTRDLSKEFILIGHVENFNHQLKTGGVLCFLNYRFQKKKEFSFSQNKLRKGSTVFYIPEIEYNLYKDKKKLKVERGEYIKSSREIFTDIFSPFAGTIDFSKSKKIIEKIKIKPGQQILLPKKKNYKTYNYQIYYPGEILFSKYKIDQISYGEIIRMPKKNILLLRPLLKYELVNTKFNLSPLILKNNSNLEIKVGGFEIKVKLKKFVKILKPLNLSTRSLNLRTKIQSTNLETSLKLEMTLKNYAQLIIRDHEILILEQRIPKEIEKIKGFFSPLVQNNQFVEAYTILATINVLNSQKLKIQPLVHSIKEFRTKKSREILLITDLDYQLIYLEDKHKVKKINYFLTKGEKIGNNLISSKSGLILDHLGNNKLLRFTQSYLFSKGATIKKFFGFVYENEQLGQIFYERARTDDIVQGLPKIEEFLEARKPKINLKINSFPGIVTDFINQSNVEIWIGPLSRKPKIKRKSDLIFEEFYESKEFQKPQKVKKLRKFQKFFDSEEPDEFFKSEELEEGKYIFHSPIKKFIRKFQFINICHTLNEDLPINPHLILINYYDYYLDLEFFSDYEAAYRSLKKVQGIILQSVQNIYHSQGVYIANKHLELIILKMTVKVEVLSSGDTALLLEELVELKQIDYVNRCLNSDKIKAKYKPVLLGITKASLKTDSFMSAASFQETTRVLTKSAIYGKTDWLQGLKENVIVGRLIPAGTGFKSSNEISHRIVRIPTVELKQEKLLEIKRNQINTKYSKIKKKINFKIFI